MKFVCYECFTRRYGDMYGKKELILSKEKRVCPECGKTRRIVVATDYKVKCPILYLQSK